MELGDKSAGIVLPCADLKLAANNVSSSVLVMIGAHG